MKRCILVNAGNDRKLLGIGISAVFRLTEKTDFRDLDGFLEKTAGQYRFITLSYDLKNTLLPVPAKEENTFPLLECWTAEAVFELNEASVLLEGDSDQEIPDVFFRPFSIEADWKWKPKQSKESYCEAVRQILSHIRRGDLYETNYCQEFYADDVDFPGIPVFRKLSGATNAPHAVFLENDNFIVAGASPELFIRKEEKRLVSRPIKGTSPRGNSAAEDEDLKNQLANSQKDKRENVMIVDLVRNDFSRVARKNSVNVSELFGVYTFETVHQMISEITCEIAADKTFCDIIEATFPMGSMTGAPKVSAVTISDRLEQFSRGIYSGSIGVILPNDDFELNVMIRSLVYEKSTRRVSCGVGGAITIASGPEDEYRECQTKVGKILSLFGSCEW